MKNPEFADTSLADLFFYGREEDILKVVIFEPATLHPSLYDALPETLVHSIWQKQQFEKQNLRTFTGELLEINKTGMYNQDTGPDFIDASVTINERCWHGDIEIHKSSSAWNAHKHHLDTRYNSTILHVSLFEDKATGSLKRQDGSLIPELVLSSLLRSSLRSLLYAHRTRAAQTLACAESQSAVHDPTLHSWIRRLGKQRLIRKKELIERAFLSDPNLENMLYQLLFIGLGYAKNCDPMLSLAQRVPLQAVRSLQNPIDIESLFLGTSGLLRLDENLIERDRETDIATIAYVREARKRFRRLNETLQIHSMSPNAWQFFRLRPSNFPTLRIAQAASLFKPGGLLHRDGLGTLASAFSANSTHLLATLSRLLQTTPSTFWHTHYRFRKSGKTKTPTIGKSRINTILLNAVIPIMLVFAEYQQDPILPQVIFQLADRVRPEKDAVVIQFKDLELNAGNAFISQGLHELHMDYCKKGKCLKCKIGISIVNNDLDAIT